MKRISYRFFVFLFLTVLTFGCKAPSKDEVLTTLKQIPTFKEQVFFISAENDVGLFYDSAESMRIKETDPKINKDLHHVNSISIFKGTDGAMYIIFLDGSNPPAIMAIHKLS